MIEICAVGGYNFIGKNMTAIKVGNEVIILDMGLHLDNYIRYTEDEDIHDVTAEELLKVGAIPDDTFINDWKPLVKAIVPSHAHLDHVGAISFLSNSYKAPIIGTPFTLEVIKAIADDEHIKLRNPLKPLNAGAKIKISKNFTIEFINTTHSTPQTVMVVLHTPEGVLLYTNDFKFDNFPTVGKKPDYKRLAELGKKGVDYLIIDSTGAQRDMKTPSEIIAKEMLREVMLGTGYRGKAVLVTTFSSHIARLKSIIEFGKKMNRKIVFLGRSLAKYVGAAEKIKLVNFSKDVEIVKFGKHIKQKLKEIEKKGTQKYLLVVTGHQGEPKATLSKMVRGDLPFEFDSEDHVIFSCKVIPSEINMENREVLEQSLKDLHVRIFKDIHVSGHASIEDIRDLINLTKPKHIIPSHGEIPMKEAVAALAIEKGYKKDKNLHLLSDGECLQF